MSNIGRKPIKLNEGITLQKQDDKVVVSGPKGNMEMRIPNGIEVIEEDGKLIVKKLDNSDDLEKFYGMTRSLLSNMVKGVEAGFERKLELSGVGYRAKMEGDMLILNVGFALPVKIKAPEGIAIKVNENVITVSGMNKELVGNVASNIRKIRPPDPYKAKGIKYSGEKIRRKAGKAAKAAATK